MANKKELKDLTLEELIEKCEELTKENNYLQRERDTFKRMYDRLYNKLKTIQNIIDL